MTSLRFVDWFCGVGGIRLGLERAGHRCVWSCEIDEFARSVYGARFGHEPEGKDIREVQASDIPEADLWVGGFPCQDLSTAGRRAGFGGGRSGLVWRLLDLAADVRPAWLLLENVPGMLSVDGGNGFGGLLARLDQLGFVGAWRVLDARFFGVPQRRRRVFILAGRAGEGRDPASLLLEPEGVRGRDSSRGPSREDVAGTLGGGSGELGWCDDLDRAGAFIPEVAASVSASAGHHGRSSPRGDGCDTMIAATLTSGGNPNSNTPGRHREDDENLVATALTAREGKGPPSDATGLVPVVGATVTATGNRRARVEDSLIPFVVNAEASCAKESHAHEVDVARCLDSTGGFASGQGGTVVACIHPDAQREGVNKTKTADAEGRVRHRDPGLGVRVDGAAFTLGTGEPPSVIAFAPTQVTHPENRSKCEPGGPSPSLAARARAPHIASEAAVRRLTPRECERLQGFPDDWTLIDRASDARRYKVIGNSVAVPVLEWIGRRLAR